MYDVIIVGGSAAGLRDELPPIPGLANYWGKAVYHCPYCHGWEARDQKIVIIGNGEVVYHFALLLSPLSTDIIACLHGKPAPTADQMKKLNQLGITVYDDGIESIEGNSEQIHGVRLDNGHLIPCQTIFVRPRPYQHSDLAQDIGCEINEEGYVQVDEFGRTSVPHIYAAGDMITPFHQLVLAAASGVAAASGINMDIAFNESDSDA
jgi:thioredoxin reductase